MMGMLEKRLMKGALKRKMLSLAVSGMITGQVARNKLADALAIRHKRGNAPLLDFLPL